MPDPSFGQNDFGLDQNSIGLDQNGSGLVQNNFREVQIILNWTKNFMDMQNVQKTKSDI